MLKGWRAWCYRFAYLISYRNDRERHSWQLRDGEAALFLRELLAARGYGHAGPIVNYPSPGPNIIPVDYSFLTRKDLILVTTRPPMEDAKLGDNRGIPRSYTSLEEKLFEVALRPTFASCGRSEIRLQDAIARISPAIAERQSMVFRQNGPARYDSYLSPVTRVVRRFRNTDHPLSAAFLLYQEHAWPGGPGLLAAFGIGGTETLVWCYQLATRFSDLLFTHSFVMAELRPPTMSERPMTIDFADKWEIEILGKQPLPPGEPAPEPSGSSPRTERGAGEVRFTPPPGGGRGTSSTEHDGERVTEPLDDPDATTPDGAHPADEPRGRNSTP